MMTREINITHGLSSLTLRTCRTVCIRIVSDPVGILGAPQTDVGGRCLGGGASERTGARPNRGDYRRTSLESRQNLVGRRPWVGGTVFLRSFWKKQIIGGRGQLAMIYNNLFLRWGLTIRDCGLTMLWPHVGDCATMLGGGGAWRGERQWTTRWRHTIYFQRGIISSESFSHTICIFG